MKNRWYRLARKIALTSAHDKFKMGAVIVRGGAVLSIAANSAAIRWGDTRGSRHAEHRAIAPGNIYNGATIFIARTNGSMSRPCQACQQKIREAGIERIIYASWDGTLIEERI